MQPDAEPLHRTARRALWWSVANNVVGRVGTTLMGIEDSTVSMRLA